MQVHTCSTRLACPILVSRKIKMCTFFTVVLRGDVTTIHPHRVMGITCVSWGGIMYLHIDFVWIFVFKLKSSEFKRGLGGENLCSAHHFQWLGSSCGELALVCGGRKSVQNNNDVMMFLFSFIGESQHNTSNLNRKGEGKGHRWKHKYCNT